MKERRKLPRAPDNDILPMPKVIREQHQACLRERFKKDLIKNRVISD